MSRSGYTDDMDDTWQFIKWRGQVASAIRGTRGQELIADLLKALDSLPEKVLITEELVNEEGDVCALGAVGKLRGIPKLEAIDPEDPDQVASAFNIAPQLAQEIVYLNDEYEDATPQVRFERMRKWAISHLKPQRAETPVQRETKETP